MNDSATPHANTQPKKCQRWSGPPEWYQAEARTRLGVTTHYWVLPTCGTVHCIVDEHLVAERPDPLDYPDGICVYCGLSADTVDHLLPRTWTGESARKRVLTVPSCRECNSMIGDSYAPAIDERREIAHEAIYRKYRRMLAVAPNIDDVLAGLGPNLRSAVQAQVDAGDLIRDRLAWPRTAGYDLGACVRSGIRDPHAAGLLTGVAPTMWLDEEYVPTAQRATDDPVFRQRILCAPGCRCRLCAKLSYNDRHRDRRALIDGVLVHPDPPGGHGTHRAFTSYGCRCTTCSEAERARLDDLPERRRDAQRLADVGGSWQGTRVGRRAHFVMTGAEAPLCGGALGGDRDRATPDRHCQSCEKRLSLLGRIPVQVWISAPRRPNQGLLDLWFNGRGVPDSHPTRTTRRGAA